MAHGDLAVSFQTHLRRLLSKDVSGVLSHCCFVFFSCIFPVLSLVFEDSGRFPLFSLSFFISHTFISLLSASVFCPILPCFAFSDFFPLRGCRAGGQNGSLNRRKHTNRRRRSSIMETNFPQYCQKSETRDTKDETKTMDTEWKKIRKKRRKYIAISTSRGIQIRIKTK